MANIFDVEPPRWLVASVNQPTPKPDPQAGAALGGIINWLGKNPLKKDEVTGKRPNLFESITESRMNLEDPLWRKHELQKDTINSINVARANAELAASEVAAREAKAWEKDAPNISKWMMDTPDGRKSWTPAVESRWATEQVRMVQQNDDDNRAREEISKNNYRMLMSTNDAVMVWNDLFTSAQDDTGEADMMRATINGLPEKGRNKDGTPTQEALVFYNRWAYSHGRPPYSSSRKIEQQNIRNQGQLDAIGARTQGAMDIAKLRAMEDKDLAVLESQLKQQEIYARGSSDYTVRSQLQAELAAINQVRDEKKQSHDVKMGQMKIKSAKEIALIKSQVAARKDSLTKELAEVRQKISNERESLRKSRKDFDDWREGSPQSLFVRDDPTMPKAGTTPEDLQKWNTYEDMAREKYAPVAEGERKMKELKARQEKLLAESVEMSKREERAAYRDDMWKKGFYDSDEPDSAAPAATAPPAPDESSTDEYSDMLRWRSQFKTSK